MRHPTHLFECLFYWLGYQIGRYPYQVIVGCLISALVLSAGLVRFEEVNNVRTEYSPRHAPSRREYEVAKEFLRQNGSLDPCYIMVRAQDGGNLLRDRYRNLLYNMTRALQTEVVVRKRGRRYAFSDICEPYCDMNTALLAFLKLYDPANPSTFTYPTIQFFGTRLFIGNNVYGVKLKEAQNKTTPTVDFHDNEESESKLPPTPSPSEQSEVVAGKALASTAGLGGSDRHLKAFTTAVLPVFMVAPVADNDVLIAWQRKASALFGRPEYRRWLKTGMTGDNLVSYEVRRMGMETGPLIIGSISAMIVFVIATSFRVNPLLSKPWEALVGCLIPLLAISTSLGIMSALEMRFQSIMIAALFLIISVGVDDIFMLLRAWHRTSPLVEERYYDHDAEEEGRRRPPKKLLTTIPERMAVALEEAGPSITISSATNVMSFIIGILSSDTPAVRSFCIFSALAVFICWFYQLVLLSAVVALSGRRESRSRQSFLCCVRANPYAKCRLVQWGEKFHHWVVHIWARIVTTWPARVALLALMALYFYVSWVGLQRLSTNISIDKMALPDSYLQDFQHSFETALRNMQPISVFVLKPGDLRRPEQLQRMKDLVHDFEHSVNAYGSETTFFWLPQYEDFLRFYSGFSEADDDGGGGGEGSAEHRQPAFTYTEIPAFFKSASYYYLSSFVHINASACVLDQPACLQSFFFMTNFHEVIKYHELVPTVRDWRRIAEKYADLSVYAYSDHTPFVDQTMSIDQTVYGSVAAGLICTAAICLLFIPHFISVLCAVFSVFSVSWGVFGLLSLWGIDLDPLSMAALIMAIGFSVDFTAHISYHYYKAPNELAPRERIEAALGVIGWPMMQVGLSTIIGLCPLLFKQSYLAMVFLKTIVAVVLLGMFHGLVVLPAVLTLFTWPTSTERSTADGQQERTDKRESSSAKSTESGFGSGVSSESSSDGGDASERSSQHSTERKTSFYKSQQFAKFLNDLGIFIPQHHKDSPSASINRHQMEEAESGGKRRRGLFPLKRFAFVLSGRARVLELNAVELDHQEDQFVRPVPTCALVHRIALGRTSSHSL